MCRFLVYKGTASIRLSDLVTKPIHSITNQTFDSRLRFPSSRPFNADGFGIGYYEPEDVARDLAGLYQDGSGIDQDYTESAEAEREEVVIGAEMVRGTEQVKAKLELAALERERPGLFKSIHPAWSNANLERLAEKIRSPLVFAHVRASTMPGAPSEDNCHPWTFNKLMWMHNGCISSFSLIKRKLQAALPDELFLFPSGYTDSEWAFALFLSKLVNPHARTFTTMELRQAILATIAHINALTKEIEKEMGGKKVDPHLLNFVVSDGKNVVATRYVSSRTDEASSLFFSSGTTFEEYKPGGHYRMTKADKRENMIMIASEPLTFEQRDWMEVKNNTMVVITPKMNLLQIPIQDDYHVPPEAGSCRTSDYAVSQGYGYGFQKTSEHSPQEVS